MANLKNVIYLSNEDYETLVSTGTVTIDGETLTYDENNVYVTPDKLASTTEDGLMSSSDKVKLNTITGVTNTVTSGSTDVVTSGAVYTAIENLPEPMVFKGTLGAGGTITSLPTASSANEGFTYKVITAGTYASQSADVGDVFISNGNAWTLVPSGDEPSGTVTNVATASASGSHLTLTGGPITSSGTITVGVESGYSIPSTTKQGEWDSKYDKPSTGIPSTDLAESYYLASNPSGYITSSALTGYATQTWVGQQGYLTSVSWSDVSDKPTFATVATSGSYNDLTNKPTIPAAQVQTDWNATSGMGVLLNKPTLATVATSGSYNDLSNKPSIPTSINGMSGGSLTSPLTMYGGDSSTASKLILDASRSGQVTDQSNATLFGFLSNNATTFTVGGNSYSLNLRGNQTRPKYKGDDLALYSDIPAAQVNSDWNATSGVAQILNKPSIPSSTGDLTNDRFVRYDTASQGLTDTQKSNARTNIGAGTSNFTGYTSSNKLSTDYINNVAGWSSFSGYTSSNKLSTDYINNVAGWTSNAGTVTSVSAGTGLSISGTSTVNPTINIDTGYSLMSSGPQTFSGDKGFNGAVTFNGNVSITNKPLKINSDDTQTYTSEDWDASFYADKIEILNADTQVTTKLQFPFKGAGTYTLATIDDAVSVAIVDLRS